MTAGPPPIITATPIASKISARVAPAPSASCTWYAMQPSQRDDTDIPRAINSFMWPGSAPLASAFLCRTAKPDIGPAASRPRYGISSWSRSYISGQLWIMVGAECRSFIRLPPSGEVLLNRFLLLYVLRFGHSCGVRGAELRRAEACGEPAAGDAKRRLSSLACVSPLELAFDVVHREAHGPFGGFGVLAAHQPAAKRPEQHAQEEADPLGRPMSGKGEGCGPSWVVGESLLESREMVLDFSILGVAQAEPARSNDSFEGHGLRSRTRLGLDRPALRRLMPSRYSVRSWDGQTSRGGSRPLADCPLGWRQLPAGGGPARAIGPYAYGIRPMEVTP